ncbi:MAG: hypothetical protein KTR31_19530 [Myxococcales bacterium]|nr:hypothetical protein [Myxococcales bacterium]
MIEAAWLFSSIALAAPPGDEATWEELRDDVVRVECTEVSGEPWCRSTGLVSAPIAKVSATLENMAEHQDKFEAVHSIRVLAPDTLHITLDYPGMLSDRDYVARYTPTTDGDAKVYRWESVTHADAPPVDGVVRLIEFGGEWRLVPEGSNTRVTYVWHADLRGSFPNWAVGIARRRAGHEALKDLAGANGTKLVKR